MELSENVQLIETKYGKISQSPDEFAWDQRYRPTTIDECILPAADKTTMRGFIKSGRIDNMTLVSDSPGTGKTTLALVLANEIDAEVLFVNGSDCGVNFIRNEMDRFASSMTQKKGGKIILIDEFDRPGMAEAQKHMRSFIEAYSKNVTVIITANNINGIHPALISRCPVVKFGSPSKEERVELMKQMIKRCFGILEIEKIEYDQQVIAGFVKKHYPDARSIVKALGFYSKRGKIDAGILSEIVGSDITPVIEGLKSKNFKALRAEAIKYAPEYETFLAKLLDAVYPIVTNESKVALIQAVGENNAQYGLAVNKEIHLQYLFMGLMLTLAWEA
ncbi:DNA polymerase clamp loader subunit [Enterobacter phage vB_EcRAM-01]|nr:DNA polymerase clamp loader subunit [Enterobacter phage vB_EcRAM-01]